MTMLCVSIHCVNPVTGASFFARAAYPMHEITGVEALNGAGAEPGVRAAILLQGGKTVGVEDTFDSIVAALDDEGY